MKALFRSALVALPLALAGCSASVTTFSGDISAPPPPSSPAEARAYCDAEIRGRSTTHEIAIGPDGGARTTREKMSLCLQRYGF